MQKFISFKVTALSWWAKYLQQQNCHQLDSTIPDALLQALGFDKSFYGYTKVFK